MPTSPLNEAVFMLRLSVYSAMHTTFTHSEPLQRRLARLGAELERLAGEAYRLADEAGDDAESNPNLDPCREPIPGFPNPDNGHGAADGFGGNEYGDYDPIFNPKP